MYDSKMLRYFTWDDNMSRERLCPELNEILGYRGAKLWNELTNEISL